MSNHLPIHVPSEEEYAKQRRERLGNFFLSLGIFDLPEDEETAMINAALAIENKIKDRCDALRAKRSQTNTSA